MTVKTYIFMSVAMAFLMASAANANNFSRAPLMKGGYENPRTGEVLFAPGSEENKYASAKWDNKYSSTKWKSKKKKTAKRKSGRGY